MSKSRNIPWPQLDEWIYADAMLLAIRAYRELMGCGLNDAVEAIHQRQRELQAQQPERFKRDTNYRREAWERLKAICTRIVVVEASWDGDSDGWFLRLSAITEQPSVQHPRFTEHGLYSVRGLDRQVARAIEFGTKLAEACGAEFCLTETEPGDRRWWDTPVADDDTGS